MIKVRHEHAIDVDLKKSAHVAGIHCFLIGIE